MTLEDFEKEFEGKGFSEPQKAYITAKAWKEFLEKQEDEVAEQIVYEHKFFYPKDWCGHKKGERITSGFDSCALTADQKEWDRFYALVYAEYEKRGIAQGFGKSLTYESHKIFDKACSILIDWLFEKVHADKELEKKFPVTDLDWVKKHIGYREKFCEIAMKIKGVA